MGSDCISPDHCLSFYLPQCFGNNGHGLSPAQRAMHTI